MDKVSSDKLGFTNRQSVQDDWQEMTFYCEKTALVANVYGLRVMRYRPSWSISVT